MKLRVFSVLSVVMFFASTSPAALMINIETDKAPAGPGGAPYSPTFAAGGPSSSDLVQGAAPSAQTDVGQAFTEEASTGVAALTDGNVDTFYGDQTDASDHSAYLVGDGGDSLTYDLGGSYDLESIVIFGGWNDGGRDHQLYEVLLSTDGGANFNSLGSVDSNNGIFGTDTTPVSTRAEFVDDAGILAAGVTHVRVDFGESENGYSGYTEIDVNAIPEPSTVVVLSLAIGVAALRNRFA